MTSTTSNTPGIRRLAPAQQNAAKAETQNAPTVQETAPSNKRKKPVTWKDLTIKYMLSGIDAITPDLNESGDAVGALEKMIAGVQANGKDSGELDKLRDFYMELRQVGTPGRQPVKVGDSREYSVQQAGDEGDLFVRIPVNMLPVERHAKIVARFEENRIVLALE